MRMHTKRVVTGKPKEVSMHNGTWPDRRIKPLVLKRIALIGLGLLWVFNSLAAHPGQFPTTHPWHSGDTRLSASVPALAANADAVERYGLYELSLQLEDSAYANPWEQVALSAQFVGPDGQTFAVDGFYDGADQWKVRFSPPTDGSWTWTLTLAAPTNEDHAAGAFSVAPSPRPGWVRLHPTNPFRLAFEDGSLFNAIGIGDCILDTDDNGNPLDNWGFDGDFRPRGGHDAGSSVDLSTYLAAYGAGGAGFNLFRWSVDNCAFKLWDTISTSGNRYLVQEGLWGDQLVQALRDNGFRIWMTVFGFKPPFPEAAENPQQQDAIRRYLRYVVARYGAYVDVWELMNEAQVPDGWITFAGDFLRSIDPYGHPITTSWERPQLPQIQINAPHWYERESELESDLRTAQRIGQAKHWGKPVVFGEQGNVVQNWDERSGLRMRLRSWTAFFEEGVLIFWNSSFAKDYHNDAAANLYIGPEERGYVRVLRDFTAGSDAQLERFELRVSSRNVRAYGLRSPGLILGYFHHFSDHDTAVGTSATLEVSAPGTLRWIDPATGNVVQSSSIGSGLQTLKTPDFVVDLALKIQLD